MSEFLTVGEVAERLRCNFATVHREIKRRNLRATKVAGRWLITPDDLRAYVDSGYNVRRRIAS